VAGDYHQHRDHLIELIEPAGDDVRRATAAFAPPPGFDRVTSILEQHNLVVIEAAVGTGRRTAALKLLAGDPGGTLRELQTEWPTPRASLLPASPGARYLLDLTHEAGDIETRFGLDLNGYADRLGTLRGRMVITVTPERWRRCRGETSAVTVQLGVPNVEDVLRAHLQYDPTRTRSYLWGREPLPALIAELTERSAPPGDVVRLIDMVREIEDPDRDLGRVSDEAHSWRNVLDEQLGDASSEQRGVSVTRHTLAQQRALLIATAVLDGLPAEVVCRSSQLLLEQLGAAPQQTELLTGPELQSLVSNIGAAYEKDVISISSRRHGIDVAVLDRLWVQRPQLRRDLLSWLSTITTDRGVAARYATRVADVLAHLAIRQRSLETLDVIHDWLARGSNRRVAIRMLEDLSISPDVGSPVRRRLYEWASTKSMEAGVLTGVAEVCGGKLGAQQLPAALTRLRLIGGSDSPEVRRAFGSSLRQLASQGHLRRHLVDQVLAWLTEAGSRGVGTIGFVAIADPDAGDDVAAQLIADAARDAGLRTVLSDSWSRAMADNGNRPTLAKIARRWQELADDGTLDAASVTQILAPVIRTGFLADGIGELLFGMDDRSPTRDAILRLVVGTPPIQAAVRTDQVDET
jgi:hypothetical protein